MKELEVSKDELVGDVPISNQATEIQRLLCNFICFPLLKLSGYKWKRAAVN